MLIEIFKIVAVCQYRETKVSSTADNYLKNQMVGACQLVEPETEIEVLVWVNNFNQIQV